MTCVWDHAVFLYLISLHILTYVNTQSWSHIVLLKMIGFPFWRLNNILLCTYTTFLFVSMSLLWIVLFHKLISFPSDVQPFVWLWFPNSVWGFLFSISLPKVGVIHHFGNRYSDRYVVLTHCRFNFHFSDDYWYCIFQYTCYTCHLLLRNIYSGSLSS